MLVAKYRKAYLELIDDIVKGRLTAVNESQVKKAFSGLFEELHKSYRLYEKEVKDIIYLFSEEFLGLDPKDITVKRDLEKTYFKQAGESMGLRGISARNKLFMGILNKMNSAYLVEKDIYDCVGFKIVIDDPSTPEVPFEALHKKRSVDDLVSLASSEKGFEQWDSEKLSKKGFDAAFNDFIRFYIEKYEKKNEKAAEEAAKWFLDNIEATDWEVKKDISDMVFSYKGKECTVTSQEVVKIGQPDEKFFLDIIHFNDPKKAKDYIKSTAERFKESFRSKDGEITDFGRANGELKNANQSFYAVEKLTEDIERSIILGRNENLVVGFRKQSADGSFRKLVLGGANSLLDIVLSKVHDEEKRYKASDESLLPSGILPGKKEHSAINFKLKDFEIPREYIAKQTIDPKIIHRIYGLDFLESGSPFRDYIMYPKPNGYSAIHGRLVSGKPNLIEPIEFQITTSFKRFFNEYSEASHSAYRKYKLENINLVKRLGLKGNKERLYNKLLNAIKAGIIESYESEIERCTKALKAKDSDQSCSEEHTRCYNEASLILNMLKKEFPEKSFRNIESELKSLQPAA